MFRELEGEDTGFQIFFDANETAEKKQERFEQAAQATQWVAETTPENVYLVPVTGGCAALPKKQP